MYLDNKYSRTYYALIAKAVTRNFRNKKEAKSILGYVEKHHITPRCIGGDNSKSNLVFLTAKEHFVCHHLLTKMFSDVEVSRKMRFALNKMTRRSDSQNRYQITARLFHKIRNDFGKDISAATTGKKRKPLSENHKNILSSISTGVPKSKETIALMTIANRKLAEDRKLAGDHHPSKGKKFGINKKTNGIPKVKTVCRLSDRKEMDMGNFTRWSKTQL